MKRCGLVALLMLTTALGCFTPPKKVESPTPAVVKPKRAAAVTVDQITENNARPMAQALWDELNREAPTE
jgi:starvation-inducible outer membrane lipoprotein